jgi:hypothetical protein
MQLKEQISLIVAEEIVKLVPDGSSVEAVRRITERINDLLMEDPDDPT